tara:strand:- start:435 stop:1160 length:726 start_codon:yes stop_codon:yes gene_type:complete
MRLIIYIFFIGVLFSCKKDNNRSCFKSNGITINKTQNINSHNDEITIYDDINLILINDSLNYINIQGPKNLIDLIEIIQNDNHTSIKNNNKCSFLRKNRDINVEYHYNSLNLVQLEGHGDLSNSLEINHSILIKAVNSLSSINLKVDNDSIKIILQNGSTDVKLSGKCNYFYIYDESYAPLKAFNLEADKVHIHSNSISNAQINVLKDLNAEIRSKGNVYYKGNPSVIKNTSTSSGRLIQQ